MDVSETLRTAWAAVENADLPEAVHEVAFAEAVRLLVPVQVAAAAVTRVGKREGERFRADPASLDEDAGIGVPEEVIYERVAAQTGVARDQLEQVVHLDGDVLKVSLPGLKLGNNNAERTRAVAQILTVSRSFGLEESETSLEVVRTECIRLRVYDQNNFSSHIKALSGYVVTGSGTNRRLRAKSAGIAAFSAVVEALVVTTS